MKTTLSILLAEKLKEELYRIIRPNARETSATLAARFGVSRAVMQKALRLLRDDGYITYGRGGPVYPIRSYSKENHEFDSFSTDPEPLEPNVPDSSSTSSQRMYSLLKEKIIRGEWVLHEQIPKISFLSQHLRVGRNAVVAALQKLHGDGLLFRRGRRYVVGSHAHIDDHYPFSDKVVCVITSGGRTWEEFQEQKWGVEYVHSILRTLSVHKMRLVVCNVYDRKKLDKPELLKDGYDAIEKRVASIRNELLGFICIFNLYELPNPAWICLQEVFDFLTAYGRPIVWFDSTAEIDAPYPRVRHVTPSFSRYVKTRGPKLSLFRCYPDIRDAPLVALGALHENGHETIGMVLFRRRIGWMRYREQELYRTRDRHFPQMKLVPFSGSDPNARLHDDLRPEDFRRRMRAFAHAGIMMVLDGIVESSAGKPFSRLAPFEREFITITSILAPLVAAPGLTAMIAPHDRIAKRIMTWCEWVGISIPERFSLVSFDNRYSEHFPHPFSSVDFGFERLGTLSVHILLGTAAPRRDHLCGTTTPCTLNHRGSIGPPHEEQDLTNA